jgi:DNA-binding response OmpR family regulator
MAGRILLVEDDPTIGEVLTSSLRSHAYEVFWARTGADGLARAGTGAVDLVVLDLGLPDLDGAELLPMLRAVSRVPVIVATARDGDAEMVPILNSGADDYVVKPFSAAQLDARVRAVLRRMGDDPSPDTSVTVAGLRLDPRSRDAVLDGAPLELTPREFDLLHFLATRAGEVVTKRELMTEVWQVPYGGADKTVDVHLSWLRRKLGETAQNPRYLLTVRGVGVKLVEPT